MQKEEEKEAWLSRHALAILMGLLAIAVIVSVVAVWAYFSHFGFHPERAEMTGRAAAWGQLGDFFGGTLNPIFGLLSVLALFVTIVYQRSELKLSREELKLSRGEMAKSAVALDAQNKAIQQQRFEQTFFAWLGTYRELLNSVECRRFIRQAVLTEEAAPLKGRQALHDLWNRYLSQMGIQTTLVDILGYRGWDVAYGELKDGVSGWRSGHDGDGQEVFYPEELNHDDFALLLYNLVAKDEVEKIRQAGYAGWERLYRSEEYQLDSLLRSLYRLIQWVDKQSSTRLNNADKWVYVSIIRSHLSWIEMVYLFFNGMTERGRKFRTLVNKYALFDNLATESDLVISLFRRYPPSDHWYDSTAFESAAARLKMGLPENLEDTLLITSGGEQDVLV